MGFLESILNLVLSGLGNLASYLAAHVLLCLLPGSGPQPQRCPDSGSRPNEEIATTGSQEHEAG